MSHMLRQLHLGYPLIGSLPQSLRWTSSPRTNNFQPLHPVDSLEVHEAAINSCGTMDLKKGIETDNSKGGKRELPRICRGVEETIIEELAGLINSFFMTRIRSVSRRT